MISDKIPKMAFLLKVSDFNPQYTVYRGNMKWSRKKSVLELEMISVKVNVLMNLFLVGLGTPFLLNLIQKKSP